MDSNTNRSQESVETSPIAIFDAFLQYIQLDCNREFSQGEEERGCVPLKVHLEGAGRFECVQIEASQFGASEIMVQLVFTHKEGDYQPEDSSQWGSRRIAALMGNGIIEILGSLYPSGSDTCPEPQRFTAEYVDANGRLQGALNPEWNGRIEEFNENLN